jgi:ankyrin repeat protein
MVVKQSPAPPKYSQQFPRQVRELHLAAYFGLVETFSHYLKRGVKPDLKDGDGGTPLSHAAANGHEDVVELLLPTGQVDPDCKDKLGRTPLSRAAENSRDRGGRTPLSWAAGAGSEAVV